MSGGGEVEEAVCRGDQPFAEQRPAHLQHELVVVLKAELDDALEDPHGAFAVTQLEQRLADARETVLVVGIDAEGRLEAPPRPGEFFPGQMGVGLPDVEFDGVGVECDALLQDGQSFIVAAFVVELMGLFVEVVGAEECIRHRRASPGRLS
jgi:hypothetical protein